MAAVVIKGLLKRFGVVTAVDAVSFEVADGEILALVGPSGCGKTTTLRCIAGLEQPSGGEIMMGGKVLVSGRRSVPTEQRDIGMMFQSYALWPHMTVWRNIAYALEVARRPRTVVQSQVAKVVELLGLEPLVQRYPRQLSGGQQQRVALARSLAVEPQVLLFDEPLSNLDAKMREEVRIELKQLLKQLGITAIYVTHDQTEAMVVADRIAVMNGGRIEQVGTPQEIYFRPRTEFVADFVGSINLLRGVWEKQDGQAQLVVGPTVTVRSGLAGDGHAELNEQRKLAIWPEHVSVGRVPLSGDNVFAGIVEETLFLGASTQYTVKLGDLRLRCSQVARRGSALASGSQCYVQLRPADLILL